MFESNGIRFTCYSIENAKKQRPLRCYANEYAINPRENILVPFHKSKTR